MQGTSFLLLYALRRSYFQNQSIELYRRYGQTIVVLLLMFGLMLSQRPSAVAAPLLHFARQPQDWSSNLLAAAAWMLLVAVWARIHRPFVQGGSLSVYARSLPCPARTHVWLDLALLLTSQIAVALLFAVAAATTLASAQAAGADGRFWCYLVLLAMCSIAIAKATVFAVPAAQRLGLLAAWLVLGLAPPSASQLVGAALPLAMALALGVGIVRADYGSRQGQAATRPIAAILQRYPILFLASLQAQLLRQHWHAVLPRLALAIAAQYLAWWLIEIAGKHDDARIFLTLASAASVVALSGLYYIFFTARQGLEPYLRSIVGARLRLRLWEHLIIGALAAALLLGAALLYRGFGSAIPLAFVFKASLFQLLLLPLLGMELMQRHAQGVNLKFALFITWLILAFNLL